MSTIAKGEIIYIDSDRRNDPTNTRSDDFNYTILIPTNKGYDTICVMSATVKKAWYLVQSNARTFKLIENNVTTIITLAIGNYSASSFALIVSALLTASSSQAWTYSISLPDISTQVSTAKFTFTVTGNGALQPSFLFSNSLCYQFGFVANSTSPLTVPFIGSSLISANCVDFQLDDTIYINSDITIGNGQTNRIQEISVSNSDYSNIVYKCISIEAYSKPMNLAVSNSYNFKLTNHDNEPIIMNGINWLMSILVYKKK